MARDPRAPGFNLIGAPVRPVATGPGITIVKREDTIMPKAETDGVYQFPNQRGRFAIRAGDPIPQGAEFTAKQPARQERAHKSAPENKAKPAAPENKAQKSAPENK